MNKTIYTGGMSKSYSDFDALDKEQIINVEITVIILSINCIKFGPYY